MAIIKPFKALRPTPESAKQVSCVPYDVVYGPEVNSSIESEPMSFLRVTRAEGDFPAGSEPAPSEVFAKARQNLDWFIEQDIYKVDGEDAVYIYQLSSDEHQQTGVVACCSLDDYESGVIKRHENVRPDKVQDRTDHLLAVGAQTGLILVASRGTKEIRHLTRHAVREQPIYDFVDNSGVRQRVWKALNSRDWVLAFREVPSLYIADGHHRIESARRAREVLRGRDGDSYTGTEDYNFVLAGIFPAEELRILPYDRTVKGLNGLGREEFFAALRQNFIVGDTVDKVPPIRGEFCMYYKGEWFKLRFRCELPSDPVRQLDVSLLQDHILKPVLGIDDVTTDERIGFVGGIHAVDELERAVNEGRADIAFSLCSTLMEDLLTVSDMGEIMPPKSTWFEPKLKDGLLVHLL